MKVKTITSMNDVFWCCVSTSETEIIISGNDINIKLYNLFLENVWLLLINIKYIFNYNKCNEKMIIIIIYYY